MIFPNLFYLVKREKKSIQTIMSKVGQVIKFVKKIVDATTIHANTISHCQYCSCKIDSGEKMTVLDHAPEAICGHCNHRIDAHLD